MANENVDTFLQVEEYAHRLAEELTRLKSETDSYKAARTTLDQAAVGVTTLASSLGEISGRLALVVETLRTIGTPELLRRQEVVTGELVSLRQDLSATERSVMEAVAKPVVQLRALNEALDVAQQANQQQLQRMTEQASALRQELEQRHVLHQQEVLAAKKDLSARVANGTAAIATVRKLAVGSIGLSVTALGLLIWAMMTLVRG